jgi:hypothetical protein
MEHRNPASGLPVQPNVPTARQHGPSLILQRGPDVLVQETRNRISETVPEGYAASLYETSGHSNRGEIYSFPQYFDAQYD